MGSDPTLAHRDVARPDLPDTPAATSWADRSTEELRRIMSHGVLAGDDFQNAAREMERRARVVAAQTEQDDTAHGVQQVRLIRYVLIGLAFIFIAGLVAGLLL